MRRAWFFAPLLLAACQQAAPPTGSAQNRAPSVELTADRDSGPVPLTVALTALGADPDGDPLIYIWSISGPGFDNFEDEPSISYTFTEPGAYTVEVVTSDGVLESTPDSVEILVSDPNEGGL